MDIRIATRRSELALWQAEHVADRLRRLPAVGEVSLVPLTTRGDRVLDRTLQKVGGKGLFIKELEVAIRTGDADIAVHSMKDVPADMPADFCIAAVLERANPLDALVSGKAGSVDELPAGAIVGSSSLRRQAQLLASRPDLEVRALRGNVNTRLRKLDEGEFDAIVLACAGLERLGLARLIRQQLPATLMLPAAGQGVIGIECLAERDDLRELLGRVGDESARVTTTAERAVAKRLEATCHSPVAAYAEHRDGELSLTALVASSDGKRVLRHEERDTAQRAERLGARVASLLLEQGAAGLLGGDAPP